MILMPTSVKLSRMKQILTPARKTQLTNLLTERRKVGSDLIKSLNNQLNLAISLELTNSKLHKSVIRFSLNSTNKVSG